MQNRTTFCLFCYKSVAVSSQNHNSSFKINKFVKIFNRFSKRHGADPLFTHCNVKELLECCNNCTDIITSFCRSYTQLEIIEMQLVFKINKLVENIIYANKVPARWLNVNRVLQETFPDDLEKKAENQNRIRRFRQELVISGHQNKLKSQPRVFLNRQEIIIPPVKPPGEPDVIKSSINQCSRAANRKTRKRSHFNSDKRIMCPKCGKTLKTMEGLKIHLENHKDQKEWQYQCRFCSKKFTFQSNLNSHLRFHTGERPFKCRFCNSGFRYRSNFTSHLKRVHSNEKGVDIEKELKRKWIGKSAQDNMQLENDNSFPKVKVESLIPPDRKYSLREKQITKYLSLEGIESENSNEDSTVNNLPSLSTNEDSIEFTTFPDDFDETEYAEMPELEDFSHENNDHISNGIVESSALEAIDSTPTFKDPLIQVKIEHQPVHENGDLDFTEQDILMTNDVSMETNVYAEEVDNSKTTPDPTKNYKTNQCPKCGKVFNNAYVLTVHMEYHKDPKDWKWKCNKCEKKFARKLNLQAHMKAHTRKYQPEKPYMIEIKKRKLLESELDGKAKVLIKQNTHSDRYELREHRITRYSGAEEICSGEDDISEDNTFKPDADDTATRQLKITVRRERDPNRPKLKLGMTRRKKLLIAGPRSKKSALGPKPFVLECEVCTRKFTSFLNKEYHFKKCHDLKQKSEKQLTFNCDRKGCTAYFMTKHQLHTHFQLEHYEKVFQKSDEIDKRFPCPKCKKRFAHRSTFEVHLEYHKDPSDWKWECEICGKKSATEFKLKEHMRVHTKEKPFKCRFCSKRFRYTPMLNEHLKQVHEDEEEVKAEIYGTQIDVLRENTVERENSESDEENGNNLVEINESEQEENNESESVEISNLGNSNENNPMKWTCDYFGDGSLVEFEDLD